MSSGFASPRLRTANHGALFGPGGGASAFLYVYSKVLGVGDILHRWVGGLGVYYAQKGGEEGGCITVRQNMALHRLSRNIVKNCELGVNILDPQRPQNINYILKS